MCSHIFHSTVDILGQCLYARVYSSTHLHVQFPFCRNLLPKCIFYVRSFEDCCHGFEIFRTLLTHTNVAIEVIAVTDVYSLEKLDITEEDQTVGLILCSHTSTFQVRQFCFLFTFVMLVDFRFSQV
jgi:hypothetical protein